MNALKKFLEIPETRLTVVSAVVLDYDSSSLSQKVNMTRVTASIDVPPKARFESPECLVIEYCVSLRSLRSSLVRIGLSTLT
jgi:hypothetical protein